VITYRCACGHQLQAPFPQAGAPARCPYCGTVGRVPVPHAAPVVRPAPVPAAHAQLTVLYSVLLTGGICLMILIYTVFFDDLSESELVTITPLWFFPIVFGVYGLIAQRLISRMAQGRASGLAEAARLSGGTFGLAVLLGLFPFLFLRWRSPLLITAVAALFWAVLLFFFFAVVFPAL
jgi:hypothetical protein